MHASSIENMERCYGRYVPKMALESQRGIRVLDIGGSDINGSYRSIFCDENITYLTADIDEDSGVDVVLEDPYQFPLDDGSVDIVLSGQMLEHCEFFWESFKEMVRVINDDGFIFLVAPSAGPIHRFPVDCYRFYPDAYRALAKFSGCHLVEVWRDERGPWQDLVGVFSKKSDVNALSISERMSEYKSKVAVVDISSDDPLKEVTSGGAPYLEILDALHKQLEPSLYLEIGVRNGNSLRLANCESIAIDPAPAGDVNIAEDVTLFAIPSDDFFYDYGDSAIKGEIDFAFIDGMHLFENVLRDFMHVEKYSKKDAVIAIDDIFPNHPAQATRDRKTRVWTGDVWKIVECLKRYRPDLTLTTIDSNPTGLLLVSGLDPQNRILWDMYNPIVREFSNETYDSPPEDILLRIGSLSTPSFLSTTSQLQEGE